jgi:hypothetical protein
MVKNLGVSFFHFGYVVTELIVVTLSELITHFSTSHFIVSSSESNFRRPNIIYNYLRSATAQEILSNLSIL